MVHSVQCVAEFLLLPVSTYFVVCVLILCCADEQCFTFGSAVCLESATDSECLPDASCSP